MQVMLTSCLNSALTFPTYASLQVYDAKRRGNPRPGRDLGILSVVVLPQSVRLEQHILLDTGRRQRYFRYSTTSRQSVTNASPFLLAAADGTKDMQGMNAGMPGMGMPGAPAQDFTKLYTAEKENLELVLPELHKWVGDDVEERLLARYGKISK